jgi:hypothetical protein
MGPNARPCPPLLDALAVLVPDVNGPFRERQRRGALHEADQRST